MSQSNEGRLVAGVQGMVASLPPHYTVRFALVGSSDGVTSAVMRYVTLSLSQICSFSTKFCSGNLPDRAIAPRWCQWLDLTLCLMCVCVVYHPNTKLFRYGALLRKAHRTAHTKLTLADDVLSSQLHYVNDGGSLLNYCDYWPQCLKSTSRQFPTGPVGCTPMAFTLQQASAYHKSLGP